MTLNRTPVTLEGRYARLEPLGHHHKPALARVAFDADLWQFTPTQIHSDADLDPYVETALAWQADGTALPFATIDRASDLPIGSTRYGNRDYTNRRAEIGWTWLGRPFQRKAFNTEAKLLMLSHAFESMSCIRVEFKVDVLNVRSRKAVSRLGAREEGILRHHMILPDGRFVDWVFYSILIDEWPSVRANLEAKLAAHKPKDNP